MIITNNEEALRVKCEPVSLEEVGQLVEALESELNNSNRLGNYGIGLAAPQIGIAKDIAIVRLGNNLNINLVNCKIEKGYDPKIFTSEGCLSFPGRSEDTTRYQEIVISNNLTYPHKFIAVGLFAVVCQHEIDHLNESLFFDRKIKNIKNGKVGPNDPCICGKVDILLGKVKKFKKCCGARK
jgi:peptide deformylase